MAKNMDVSMNCDQGSGLKVRPRCKIIELAKSVQSMKVGRLFLSIFWVKPQTIHLFTIFTWLTILLVHYFIRP